MANRKDRADRGVPDDPESRPQETVDALENHEDSAEQESVTGEDVTENPDTDELEGLPGPAEGEPGEPAG